MGCSTFITDSKVVFQDGLGKTKMCFNNPKRKKVEKIIVDNCLITEGKRCDFLLIDHDSVEHFVELKGKEVEYACVQLAETIKRISKDLRARKFSYVVSSACPITTSEVQVLKAKFKKNFNCNLIIKNVLCEHNIS